MTVLEAINEYKKCVDEITQLLFVFASVIDDDRVKAGHLTQLGWTIDEVKGYHTGIMRYDPVKRIKDAIIGDMPDKKELQKRLAYVWHELSEKVAFVENEETGYFPVFDEKIFCLDNKELFNVLCKLEGKNYAFTVLTHLEGVVLWTNIRISEVYKMLCELSDFAGMNEQEKVTESSSITSKKSTKKKKIQNFSDIIQYHDKKGLLNRLHFLIDDRGGADVGAVIQKAKMAGYLTRYPYEGEFRQEFEVIGNWKAISNYFNEDDNKCLAKSADVIIFKDKISN